MFQFPALAPCRSSDTRKGVGFPHSDIPGSSRACPLPEAFRRLLRPSSPLAAKASTTCPSHASQYQDTRRHLRHHRAPNGEARDGTTSASTRPSIVAISNGGDRIRTDDPLRAKQVLSQAELRPRSRRREWARGDLNTRPHAYQACALNQTETSPAACPVLAPGAGHETTIVLVGCSVVRRPGWNS